MKLHCLVEGKTDGAACEELVAGLAGHYAPRSLPIEWHPPLTAGCHELRKAAGPILRAAASQRAVILTDAWCDVYAVAGKGKARGKKVTDYATTRTSRVMNLIRQSLASAGRTSCAVGVACVELETWFLLSSSAMQEANHQGRGLRQDAQGDCDSESVNRNRTGKYRLEALVDNYTAAMARRMARAIVQTPHSTEALMRASASFHDFARHVVRLLGGAFPELGVG